MSSNVAAAAASSSTLPGGAIYLSQSLQSLSSGLSGNNANNNSGSGTNSAAAAAQSLPLGFEQLQTMLASNSAGSAAAAADSLNSPASQVIPIILFSAPNPRHLVMIPNCILCSGF
ncbi:MAG: hypothetical protein MHMPM18_003565 [Marteilia pararefringens]